MALNAIFRCDDGADYRIVETEDRVSWVCVSADGSFSNVFNGRRTGDREVRGLWYDLPSGSAKGHGELSLQVTPDDSVIFQVASTGRFGGTRWVDASPGAVVLPPRRIRTQRRPHPSHYDGEDTFDLTGMWTNEQGGRVSYIRQVDNAIVWADRRGNFIFAGRRVANDVTGLGSFLGSWVGRGSRNPVTPPRRGSIQANVLNPNLIELVSENGDAFPGLTRGPRWARRRSIAFRAEIDDRTNRRIGRRRNEERTIIMHSINYGGVVNFSNLSSAEAFVIKESLAPLGTNLSVISRGNTFSLAFKSVVTALGSSPDSAGVRRLTGLDFIFFFMEQDSSDVFARIRAEDFITNTIQQRVNADLSRGVRPSYRWLNRDFRDRIRNKLRNFGLGGFDPDDIMGSQIRRFSFDELIEMNGSNDFSLTVRGSAIKFRLIVDASAFV